MKPNIPPSGSLVTFSTVPCGSYATAGETYRVTYRGKLTSRTTLHLWNEDRDCGTFDSPWAYERAAWTVAG